jgi:hypothetical protein
LREAKIRRGPWRTIFRETLEIGQVSGHGAAGAGQVHCIAMHFVAGISLDKRLDDGPLEPRRAAEIAGVMLRAQRKLGGIHARLKPAHFDFASPPEKIRADFAALERALTALLGIYEFFWMEEELLFARTMVRYLTKNFTGGVADARKFIERRNGRRNSPAGGDSALARWNRPARGGPVPSRVRGAPSGLPAVHRPGPRVPPGRPPRRRR